MRLFEANRLERWFCLSEQIAVVEKGNLYTLGALLWRPCINDF